METKYKDLFDKVHVSEHARHQIEEKITSDTVSHKSTMLKFAAAAAAVCILAGYAGSSSVRAAIQQTFSGIMSFLSQDSGYKTDGIVAEQDGAKVVKGGYSQTVGDTKVIIDDFIVSDTEVVLAYTVRKEGIGAYVRSHPGAELVADEFIDADGNAIEAIFADQKLSTGTGNVVPDKNDEKQNDDAVSFVQTITGGKYKYADNAPGLRVYVQKDFATGRGFQEAYIDAIEISLQPTGIFVPKTKSISGEYPCSGGMVLSDIVLESKLSGIYICFTHTNTGKDMNPEKLLKLYDSEGNECSGEAGNWRKNTALAHYERVDASLEDVYTLKLYAKDGVKEFKVNLAQ